MSTTNNNQQAERKSESILNEDLDQRHIEQRCFEIIRGFNDRLKATSLSDFKALIFYCLHDAYMLKKGATVLEEEVATMYGLWRILAEIEKLQKPGDLNQDEADQRHIERRCFEIVQMFDDRNIPLGIAECKNLIFHCLHDAYTMVNEALVSDDEVATMYNLWEILLDIEKLKLPEKGSSEISCSESKEEGDSTELQQLRERVRELEIESSVFLEVIGLVGNGCVDGEKLLNAAQRKIIEQTAKQN